MKVEIHDYWNLLSMLGLSLDVISGVLLILHPRKPNIVAVYGKMFDETEEDRRATERRKKKLIFMKRKHDFLIIVFIVGFVIQALSSKISISY